MNGWLKTSFSDVDPDIDAPGTLRGAGRRDSVADVVAVIERAAVGTESRWQRGAAYSSDQVETMSNPVRSSSGRAGPVILVMALFSVSAAACTMPMVDSSEISQGELMLQLSDALNGMRSENADLQEQIDSLRRAVVRQDSLLIRLANATGVPLR